MVIKKQHQQHLGVRAPLNDAGRRNLRKQQQQHYIKNCNTSHDDKNYIIQSVYTDIYTKKPRDDNSQNYYFSLPIKRLSPVIFDETIVCGRHDVMYCHTSKYTLKIRRIIVVNLKLKYFPYAYTY